MTKSTHAWHGPQKVTNRFRIIGWFKAAWRSFVGAVALFAAMVTLYPRLTISVAGPSDDKNPLSAAYTISNDGYLPVYSVVAQCALSNLNWGGAAIAEEGQLVAVGPNWKLDELDPGEKTGIPISNCFIAPSETLNAATVGLVVTYHPFLWIGDRQVRSVFRVRSIGAGHFYWYSSPK